MRNFFRSSRFKLVCAIIGLLLIGMIIAAANGYGESAQSSVVGTVFAPAHFVASKVSDGIDHIFKNASGDAKYEKQINDLQNQVGDLQSQLADYENLKKQNELYKEFLELKEENKSYKFADASITGRDSADLYNSFTISKGKINGVKEGDPVLYGKYLVGVIKKAYPSYSVVQTILDPSFSCSAYEIVSGEVSYVSGSADLAKDGKTKLENLGNDSSITYGSIICTAGVGGSFPKGLVIGTVSETKEETTNISTYAIIEPGVSIKDLTDCCVLINYDKSGD